MTGKEKKNLLVHICCAHCFLALSAVIPAEEFIISGFWYNPNIQPYPEYLRRRNAAVKLFHQHQWTLFGSRETYPLLLWLSALKEYQVKGKRRCVYCYRERLRATAIFARAKGWTMFTSTLAASPYQDETLLQELGEGIARGYSLSYLHFPATEQYYPAKTDARKEEVYLQNYCGCIFSLKERRGTRDAIRTTHQTEKKIFR